MTVYSKKTVCPVFLLFFLTIVRLSHAANSDMSHTPQPLLHAEETNFNLGVIQKGENFGYAFLFENRGRDDLRLLKAIPNSHGKIRVRMPDTIPAGEEGFIEISEDSGRIRGAYTLKVVIQTNDPHQPEVPLSLSGYVQWPVEILPRPWALMKVQKGQYYKRKFTLVNHTKSPLELKEIDFNEDLFEVEVRELEKGRRFELTVISQSDAPVGEHKERIIFHTNVPEAPEVAMAAWLKVHERVFTNVEQVNLGEWRLEQMYVPKIAERISETLIVNGMSTPGFKVLNVECSVDFLTAELHPIAKNGVHRIDVFFRPEKARKGTFSGFLTIFTNDQEFEKIILPLRGSLS